LRIESVRNYANVAELRQAVYQSQESFSLLVSSNREASKQKRSEIRLTTQSLRLGLAFYELKRLQHFSSSIMHSRGRMIDQIITGVDYRD
jgi:curved DNA-binding protein CbpA